MSSDNLKRMRVLVQGRVQGVGFRYHVQEQAQKLLLTGLVRNLRNGDVEVVAEGVKGALEALEVYLHRGPAMSRIDEVITLWLPYKGEFTSFSIGRTV